MAAILESQIAKKQNASYKTHSGIKLDQFQPMVLEILSFFVFMLFLETVSGGHLDRYIFILF